MKHLFSLSKNRFFTTPIIATNIGVFLLWIFRFGDERQNRFMIENFLVSWTGLSEGRFWTLLSSVFSHNMLWHLFLNMYVLNSFGWALESTMGSWRFLKFYLVAGVVGSLGHVLVSALVLERPDLPALGASGAISGVILLFSLLFKREKILIFGLIPMPAIVAAVLFVGLDIWGLIAQSEGSGLPIGHGAHLGGALTGALYYFFFRRRSLLSTY